MVIHLLYKNTFLKIKKSFGRYISLLVIIMVGVGFYAGIQITSPNVTRIADNYFQDHKLMDFKIVSSMGLTDDDVNALKQLDGVNDAMPSFSLDVQSKGNAIRIHAIEDRVNTVRLIEGRMPQSDTECVADGRNYNIGDIIEITDNVDEKIKNENFTVVGLIDSVLYLSEDYGGTSIGNGRLSSFIFINRGNFILDAYTEIYLVVETTHNAAYTDEYKAMIAELDNALVSIKSNRETARLNGILNDAIAIIEDNETELNEEIVKAEKEFADVKKELDENAQNLKEGKETGITEFANAKRELDENADLLQNGKNEIAESEALLNESIETQNAGFDSARQSIADGWTEINSALAELEIAPDEIPQTIDNLDSIITDMILQLGFLPVDIPEYAALELAIMEYSTMLESLRQLQNSIVFLNEQEKLLNEGVAIFIAEIESAKSDIENAKIEIAEKERLLNEGYDEYYANLAEFYTEIADNEQKLNDGFDEYNENLLTFNTEIANAFAEIEQAKTDLSNIERPVWYISDRKAVIGYNELESSIQIVAILAAIFPFFFILISMLMTSNSMARMIAEERGELGTLTSLGYKDRSIVFTYLLYVLSASGLGAVIGFFVGCKVIPPLIYANFVFVLPPLVLKYNMITFGIILAVTFALMIFVTIFACNKELRQNPASLMRPLPPKHGQHIFLEKISLIWKHLSFTWKITIRNMIRYKKRAFMTIVGVAGCAALLLVAFGLRDGMNGIAKKQYGEIIKYDVMIILENETQAIEDELKALLDEQQIIEPLLIKQSSYKVDMSQKLLDVFLIVPQDNELFETFFNLKSVTDKSNIVLSDGSVVITQRIATVFRLRKGDTITIKDADNNIFDMVVFDIAENYTSNYIYINAFTYAKLFRNPIAFNTIVSNHNNLDEPKLAKNLIGSNSTVGIIFTNDAAETAGESVGRLNGVIVLIVIVASILAVVVLYNLTAINISERTREIATLKVLGFRDGETNAYIYREALILTLISIGIGMVLGFVLHRFVVNIIEINALSLYKGIKWVSFIMSCVFTMVFSVFMQIITYFKLKKIDMIESLKSVE